MGDGKNPIKQYMEISDKTYQQIADITGLTKQAVWLHAMGRTRLSAKAFLAYHKAFGISYDKLAKISWK